MGGGMDLGEVFLSAKGRLGRSSFWIAAAVVLLPALLYGSIDSITLHWVTGWFVYPVLIYVGVCVLSKRLHDRGRSGWLAAPVVAAIIALSSAPLSFFDFAWGLVLVWAVVELAMLPGEQGANRFGLNPQAG